MGLFVHHLVLVVDALDVDGLQHRAYEVLAEVHAARERKHATADLLPAVALQDGHVVGFLYGPDLLAGVHASAQQVEQLGVDLVDLAAQLR